MSLSEPSRYREAESGKDSRQLGERFCRSFPPTPRNNAVGSHEKSAISINAVLVRELVVNAAVAVATLACDSNR
jgi:hypothetical protein